MSDSDEDGKGPNLASFLFGNLDEDNRLDADYLDADVREQLQALGEDKLGISENLKDLNEAKSTAGGPEASKAGEIRKAADAVNFYDEDELVDYVPPKKLEKQRRTAAPKPAAEKQTPKLNGGSKLQGPKLELPILASNGPITLLRFSKLFANPAEKPEPWELQPAKERHIEPGAEFSDEEESLHASLAAPKTAEAADSGSDDSEEEEEGVEKSDDDSGDRLPADKSKQRAPKPAIAAQAQGRRRRAKRMQACEPLPPSKEVAPGTLPSDAFHAVQLADWEQSIFWGDESPKGPPSFHEELDDEQEEDPSVGTVVAEQVERLSSGQRATTSYLDETIFMADGSWEADVRWDSENEDESSPVVPLDMNDPGLIFQLLSESGDAEELDRAAAVVLPALPKVKIASALPVGKGSALLHLARQNVSQDEDYARRKAKKGVATFKHKHSVPAMQLATLPPRHLDPREYEHRPRGVWVPPPSKGRARAKEGEKSTVKIVSLVGPSKLAVNRVFKGVDLSITNLSMLWDVLKAGAKFADCANLANSDFGLWYRGARPQSLNREVPIAETGAPQDANIELSLVITKLEPVRTATALAVPENIASAPVPVAIQKTKQLTASDGHILLLEYMEENPLLLSRPGMALRTCTYYKQTDSTDTGHHTLLQDERWKTGAVEAIPPNEDSPFLLGSVAPGKHQLAVESNMFRCPAFPHALPASDFLVIRSASGALSIRELTGSIAVGQQEPLRRVPPPSSKECRDLEEARMVAYVMRELRKQKLRNEKKKQQMEATITVRELNEMFPGISDGIIRSRLRDRCSCVPFKDDAAGTFKLAQGVAIADERELRQLVRPEEWCGHESMSAGLIRLARLGITKQDRLSAVPLDRLRIAIEQLSPPEVFADAAAELELGIQNTPWALTDNFLSAIRDGKGALALTGPGDPTSRGEGFSFMRESVKVAAEKAAEILPATVKDGTITGTNKDLRRLTMTESKTILLKLGLSEDDIKGLSRWQRIAAVRDLSTAAAAEEGGELGKIGTRYARVAKASSEEQLKARRIQAQQIFERQIAALSRVDEGLSDDESWGDELEKELENDETESQPAAVKQKQRNEDLDDEELDDIEELRKGGFLKDAKEGSSLAALKPKLEAKHGERRIKRTIFFLDANGEKQSRVLLYTDKDKISALNDIYRREGKEAVLGFGKRTISSGGLGPALEEDAAAAAKKTKKNMSKVKCKACGQMGHYKSNKLCPLYEQTYGKAAKEKREAQAKAEAEKQPEEHLKIKLSTSILSSPSKRKQSFPNETPLKRMKSDVLSPGSPTFSKSAGNSRKLLGSRVLQRAIANAKHTIPESIWGPFRMAVTKASAPDYNDFVPSAEEMHLDKIEKKLKSGKYSSGEEMLSDFCKIVQNATTYNAPGKGKYGGPAIVGWAESLLEAVKEQLQSEDLAPLLQECEAAIQAEDEERAAAASAQAVLDSEPIALEDPAPDGGGGDGAMEQWVQCSKCQKWRRISQKVADETVASASDAPWFCEWDYERANASCDLPDDYEADQAGT